MATIAKLVIQSVLDPSGVNRGAKQVIDQMNALDGVARKRRELNLKFPSLKIAEAVQKDLNNLEGQFATSMAHITERLARGPQTTAAQKSFRSAGQKAAQEFDKGILDMVERLRSTNQLTPTLHRALIAQMKTIGKNGAQALQQGMSKHIAAHPLLGNLTTTGQRAANSLLNGLQSQYQQRINDLREQLANRVITVQQFRLRGKQAADEFDKGLSAGLASMRAKGQATQPITQALIESYKLAGLKAANAFNLSVSKQMGENISGVGRTLTAAVTVPVLAAGAAATKLGADFELSMNRIQAITQATGPEMAQLAKQARKLGAESQFSAKDAADAQAKLAQQSLNTIQILGIMPTVLNVAAASLISMTDAADISTKILFGFGVPIEEMAPKMDELVKLSTIARTDIRELGDAFKFVGPSAVQAGQAFETVGAALGTLAKRGLPATLGGTALRGILQSIINPTKKAAKALKDLGIEAFNTDGSMKDLIDIVKQFEVAQARAANQRDFNQRLASIFQTRSGTGFAVLLQTGSKALGEMKKQLENAGGTAKRVADTQMAGAIGSFRELRSAVEELGQAISDSGLLKAITDIARGLATLLLAASKTNPEILKMFTQFALFAALLGPFLLLIGKVIIAVARLRAVMLALNGTAALGGLAISFATGGVILVGLALLAALLLKVAANAAKAKQQLEEFKGSLVGQGREQLLNLRKDIIESLEFNRNALKMLQDRAKTDAKFSFSESMGFSSNIKTTIALIDRQLKMLQEVDAVLAKTPAAAAEAGAAVANAVDIDIQGLADALGGLNLGAFGDDAKSAMEILSARVKTLVSLTDIYGSLLRDQPDLVAALEVAYKAVNFQISKQKDLLSEEAAQLLQMKVQLEEVFQKQEFKFAKISEADLRKMLGLDKPLSLQVVPILNLNLPTPQSAIEKAFEPFRKAAETAISAKLDLDLAKRLGRSQEIKRASQAYEAALDVASVREDILSRAIQASNLPLKEKKELLEKIVELLQQYEAKQKKAATKVEKFSQALNGIADAIRGVLSLAEAFGTVNEQVAQALTATANLFDALGNMTTAFSAGNLFAGISSAIGAAGALIALGQSLFGESAAAKEAKAIQKENTSALSALRLEIRGWVVSVRTVTNALSGSKAALELVQVFRDALKKANLKGIEFKSIESLNRDLIAAGSSIEEIIAIAKELNINIFNSKGRITAQGLDALTKAMELQIIKLTEFGKSLDAQAELLEMRRNVLNLDTSPLAAIQDQLTLLEKFAPGIRQMLGNFDVTTAQGRAALEAAVQQLFLNLEKNILDKNLFKDINIEQLSGIIKILADSFDELRKETEDVTQAVSNVPTGFKIERVRFAAMLTDLEESTRQIFSRQNIPKPVITTTPASQQPVATGEPVTSTSNVTMTFSAQIIEAPKSGRALYRELRQAAIDEAQARYGAQGVTDVTKAWP